MFHTVRRLMRFSLCVTAFPAPIMYGRVIDSVCLVQQSSCVRKGACLLYDHDNFRTRLHALPIAAKSLSICLYIAAWMLSGRRERREATAEATGNADEDQKALPYQICHVVAENNALADDSTIYKVTAF